MPKIRLKILKTEQIEFPSDLTPHSSRKPGSMHLVRGIVRDVTQEELDYIRCNHPNIMQNLDVLPEPLISSATKAKLAQAQKIAEQERQKEAELKAAQQRPKQKAKKQQQR